MVVRHLINVPSYQYEGMFHRHHRLNKIGPYSIDCFIIAALFICFILFLDRTPQAERHLSWQQSHDDYLRPATATAIDGT